MRLRLIGIIAALLVCGTAGAAPYTVRWANPTTWTDGAALAPSDLKHLHVYCRAPAATRWETWQQVPNSGGGAISGLIDISGPQVCAATWVAALPDGSLRESDYSVSATIDPKQPSKGASFVGAPVAPIACPAGTRCPIP